MEQVRGPIPSASVERVWESPRVQQLRELDFGRVELLPLVDGGVAPAEWTQQQLNESLLKKLAEYEKQGYVLLDGVVVAALLAHPQSIPSTWASLADADSMGSATLRFDGSVFRVQGKPDEFVLTPFFERGSWSFGYGPRFPRLEDPANRAQFQMSRELTVALKL